MIQIKSMVVVLAVGLSGCVADELPTRASGSLAVSKDSASLYAADTDNGLLLVIDTKTLEKRAEVKVGVRPFRVAVGQDGTIFVANRGSRSVSVVSPGDWAVVAELPTGVDPVGMQLSGDGKTLYVVSATALDDTSYGTLTAFDTATRQSLWVVPVGEEPRGLGLLADDRAVVSQFKTGKLLEIDLKAAAVANPNIEFNSRLNASSGQNAGFFGPTTFSTRAMTDVAVNPAGTRAFATAMLSRDAPILTQPTPDTPYYKGQGPSLIGSVSTSALITLEKRDGRIDPLVDDVSGFRSFGAPPEQTEYPQTSFAVSGQDGSPVLQGPSVALVDANGDWVFVVNMESSTLAIVAANRGAARPNANATALRSVHSTTKIASGADGIAILSDNATAFVYSQYEHTVQRLTLGAGTVGVVAATSTRLVADTLSPEQVAGRMLFHDANSRAMSAVEASVACSSCHLEGRDDGHTWQFPDGPRQTPTLAGRGIAATAPYHWSGEFVDVQGFLTHTITARMGGSGLSGVAVAQLNAYVDGLAAPENPFQTVEPSVAAARGAQVFEKAQCASCHSGQWFTDNSSSNVGSLVVSGINPDNGLVMSRGLNVPSLKGLARSAPYLHDGSAPSIRARVLRNPRDQHGVTSTLSVEEVDDLVAYLETL
ncbi:MAG: c-type cytochrome [Archangium sp.]|nr:c-type cytochrome [Archangium sp.]